MFSFDWKEIFYMDIHNSSNFYYDFSAGIDRLGIKSGYNCVAPIMVYCATIAFLSVMRKIKVIK